MDKDVLIAIIAYGLPLIGVIITVVLGNKKAEKTTTTALKEHSDLTIYRIDQLEQKVNKHNNLIERMYEVETRLDVDEEKLKVANNRLKDLESYHK